MMLLLLSVPANENETVFASATGVPNSLATGDSRDEIEDPFNTAHHYYQGLILSGYLVE